MTFVEAKQTVTGIRKRLEELELMRRRDPMLVRVAVGDGGDQIVFWYSKGEKVRYNVSQAQRSIQDLVRRYGKDVLRSRSGQIIELELPLPR